MARPSFAAPPPPAERAVDLRLQLALWVALTGFYWAWYKRPNYYLEGNIWPVVALHVGFALVLFYSLVYWIIPRWLLRGRYLLALAGGWLLVVAYRYWFFVGNHLALAYLPLNADLRRELPHQAGPTPWVVLVSPVQWLGTFADMLATMLFPLLVSFLAYVLLVERRRLTLERNHFRLELSYVKAQLNPQFLFHTLGHLQDLTRARSPQAGDVVLHLADLLRYTLYETEVERVPLARELEFTEDYLALERLRYPTAAITHTVTGEAEESRIAPLLLHPLLERLFEHLAPAAGSAQVTSTLQLEDATLTWHLACATTGLLPPYAQDAAVLATGRRLELQYPDRHELRVTEQPGRLDLFLRLAL